MPTFPFLKNVYNMSYKINILKMTNKDVHPHGFSSPWGMKASFFTGRPADRRFYGGGTEKDPGMNAGDV